MFLHFDKINSTLYSTENFALLPTQLSLVPLSIIPFYFRFFFNY